MRTTQTACVLALPVVALLWGLTAASAQNAPGSNVDDAVRQACTPDAMRLCSEFIPDVAKISACMQKKRRELSKECTTAMAASHPKHHRTRHVRHTKSTS